MAVTPASGAVATPLPWPGAYEICGQRRVPDKPEAMAEDRASLVGHGPAEYGSAAGPDRDGGRRGGARAGPAGGIRPSGRPRRP
ncbi:hypothetical protein ACWCRD_03560 [Streptomyces sp. NPDC002092]